MNYVEVVGPEMAGLSEYCLYACLVAVLGARLTSDQVFLETGFSFLHCANAPKRFIKMYVLVCAWTPSESSRWYEVPHEVKILLRGNVGRRHIIVPEGLVLDIRYILQQCVLASHLTLTTSRKFDRSRLELYALAEWRPSQFTGSQAAKLTCNVLVRSRECSSFPAGLVKP